MANPFPPTSPTLLSLLKAGGDEAHWQVSWKRFLELYHEPLEAAASVCYRRYTGGLDPSPEFVEDVVADVVIAFFGAAGERYDRERGRLRTYLRVLVNARVVDRLRKERPLDELFHEPLPEEDGNAGAPLPGESPAEREAFRRALLATLVEELRSRIPLRQFEVFERVKLKREAPKDVARDLGLRRAMVDRYVHKAMSALRAIAAQPEYREEFRQ